MDNKKQGNKDRMTLNQGHDIAKTRLASKLRTSGFDIYAIRTAILSHVEIKNLLEKQAIKVGRIIGQNFTIGAKNALLSEYRKVNAVNKKVTVIQQVNNIVTSILKQYGFSNYGKAQFWKNLDEKKYTYCKRITIGSDILSLDWIAKNYSKTEFTCKLSDRKKIEKYQQGA